MPLAFCFLPPSVFTPIGWVNTGEVEPDDFVSVARDLPCGTSYPDTSGLVARGTVDVVPVALSTGLLRDAILKAVSRLVRGGAGVLAGPPRIEAKDVPYARWEIKGDRLEIVLDVGVGLQSLPGTFSGLQLTCYMYVGMQMVSPSMDIGFDLSLEYQAAKRLREGKSST